MVAQFLHNQRVFADAHEQQRIGREFHDFIGVHEIARGFHASCEDAEQARFCITIDMGRYNFGQDEYKYFSYPLPDGVAELRAAFYAPLSPLANRWNAAMGMEARYPATHAAWGQPGAVGAQADSGHYFP